jgi:hypothetical protein
VGILEDGAGGGQHLFLLGGCESCGHARILILT